MNYFWEFSVLFVVINLFNNSIREAKRRFLLLKPLFLYDQLIVFLSKFKVSGVF